jgi:aldehyde:ferredoxin oxidoreductase
MRTDMISGGLAGKILRVDLNSKRILNEDTEKYARRFIGGRAINSSILLNEMDPQTKWSDSENMLIFGVGCLEGTLAPGACRLTIDTKNVFNNGKGSANCGGHFGPELKYAGFDHVVITGKAKNPVYLWIHDGNAELRDASHIWGKTTYQTESILQEELGDSRIQVASIGPAGENLVRGSCIIVDCGKVAGGSGVGCIMGSKMLKAVAVRGHGLVKVAQPERFLKAVNVALNKIESSPTSLAWRKGIIEASFLPNSPVWNGGGSPRNGQDEYWPMEKRRRLTGMDSGVPRYKKKNLACFSCPIGCNIFNEIDEGKYKNTRGMAYWINHAMYSIKFDVDEPAASIKFANLTNQLGLDGDMASVVLSWAFECYEKGLLNKEDTDGLELIWESEDAMIKMAEKLAYRQGIGNFLADGVKEASQKLGKGSEQFALHMKGQDTFDTYRIRKGWGLGLSTSPVAGRHLRGAVISPEGTGPRNLDWSTTEYKNAPEAVFWQLQAEEIENITGSCIYLGSFLGAHALEPSDYAELTSSAMGIDLTEEEFMLIGRRSYNLEKAFNTIHTDLSRKDDYPPRRYMEEPVKSGPYAGQKCDKDKWDEMLDRFYELHGWDKKTGLQTRRGLNELDMGDVAEKLERAGKLIE